MTDGTKGFYTPSGLLISPGKSTEEIKAEREAKEARENSPNSKITLSRKEEIEFEVAAANAEYLLSNAALIFEELDNLLAGNHLDGESPGLRAIMEMLGRGYRHATANEGEKLSRLSDRIRRDKELIDAA